MGGGIILGCVSYGLFVGGEDWVGGVFFVWRVSLYGWILNKMYDLLCVIFVCVDINCWDFNVGKKF